MSRTEIPGEVIETLRAVAAETALSREILRETYGVHVNYVSPIEFNGGKVWGIGTRVYLDRPPNETFHEFLVGVLANTMGKDWWEAQAEMPEKERHFVARCFAEQARFRQALAAETAPDDHGRWAAEPNGFVRYLMSLAWDVASLIHASNLPESLIQRLRDPVAYQGARYELAIAGVFARIDCEIRFLDDDETLRTQRRVEFVATHRPSGQEVAVEAKSRHRAGVLNQPGDADLEDPLRGDDRAVRALYVKAVGKAPSDLPFLVFVDINAPLEPQVHALEKSWMRTIGAWMKRLPQPTAADPDACNGFYITNFAPHYQGTGLAGDVEWAAFKPIHVAHPLQFDLTTTIDHALDRYQRVPVIGIGGVVE
jgi:hypothetical protein